MSWRPPWPRVPLPPQFGHAARVALAATLLVGVVYAGCVTILDRAVTARLVASVDTRLRERLASAVASGHPGSGPPPPASGQVAAAHEADRGGDDDDDVDEAPVFLWRSRPGHAGVALTAGAPVLPGGRVAPGGGPAYSGAAAAGVPVAHGVTVDRCEAARRHVLEPPYVLKPLNEGSSFGVVIVKKDRAHPPQEVGREDWPYGDRLLAERFVDGKELTCAVMGDRVFDIIEIQPVSETFYGYDAKYAKGGSVHVLPAKIKPKIYHEVQELTLRAHRALGCRGVSRADFRLDESKGESGELVCLEVNTQPGMTETSLVPDMAAYAGLSFGELVEWMVEDASCDR